MQDPLLPNVALAILASDLLRYLLGAALVWLLVWVALRRRLDGRRILDARPRQRQVRRELAYSMSTVFIFAANGILVWLLTADGSLRLYTDVAERGRAWWCISLVLIVVAHDAWFYWTHRLLHHRRWFGTVHGRHHGSMHPTPWAAYAFHPIEALIQASFLPAFLALVPTHTGVVAVFLLLMILRHAIGHSSHELMPWTWARTGPLRWITTVTQHLFHHARNRGNYSLYFTWWDRWRSTEDREYLADGDARFIRSGEPTPPAAVKRASRISRTTGTAEDHRPRLLVLAACLSVLLYGCADSQPARALRIASASTAMTLCTAVFVSGTSAQRSFEMEIAPAPGMRWVAWAVDYEIDRERGEVLSRIGGGTQSRAVHRPGLGCVLNPGTLHSESWHALAEDWKSPDPLPELGVPEVKVAESAPLRAAIDAAFAEDQGKPRNTLAVVVMHKGHLVGERYAAGIGPMTPLPGHSLSKSFIHALIGILAREHAVDPTGALDVPAWASPEDPRRTITANQLLAMSSGLPWDEYRGGFDPATRLWFDEADPYAYATHMPLANTPGTHWAYSNLGYTVLSRIVRDRAGGSASPTAAWIQRELLDPLHMQHTEVTFDATGTPMGANGIVASARDWARFGLLYLNDGKVGVRSVLPAGWVEQARSPTLDAGYGRGFWLNNTHAAHPLPGHWGMAEAPSDAYFGRGYLGQFIVVVPSADLVVVRLGISYRPGGDIATVGRLVRQTIDAVTQRNADK